MLRDSASSWYSTFTLTDATKNEFTTLYVAFSDRFSLQTHRPWSHVAELLKRNQTTGESVMDYITHMQKQAKLVDLPELQTLQAILSGLDPQFRPFILQQTPTTIAE